MNTISTNGQNLAMDGQNYFKAVSSRKIPANVNSTGINGIAPTGAEVAQNIVQNLAEVKEAAQQLQKLSDMVMGPKLQFRVNQELGSVIINVVDPSMLGSTTLMITLPSS